MKYLTVLLGFMALTLQSIAQISEDLPFRMDFSATSGSTTSPELSGGARYYRVLTFPPPSRVTFTNRLEFGLSSSASPIDIWLVEKQTDGSFVPLLQVTNLAENTDPSVFYLRPAPLTLTTNEVHSLIAGNWYIFLDYGENSYLGHLAPQYAYANGPTVTMVFPPPERFGYKMIALNNRSAKLVLDGSLCTDPFYLPMEYLWQGWRGYDLTGVPAFTKTGVMATNVFKVGYHIIQLQVSDPIASSQPFYFHVEVITAGQASRAIITTIRETSLNTSEQQALSDALSAAARHFDKNHMKRGCAKLELFQTLVEASTLEDNDKSYFTRKAQEIINAFDKTE